MANHAQAPHETIRAWQASYQLALEVYKVSRTWPRDERYGLTAQVRSAACSVGANIAEGLAREGPRVLTPDDWRALEAKRQEAGILAGAFAKAIRRRRAT